MGAEPHRAGEAAEHLGEAAALVGAVVVVDHAVAVEVPVDGVTGLEAADPRARAGALVELVRAADADELPDVEVADRAAYFGAVDGAAAEGSVEAAPVDERVGAEHLLAERGDLVLVVAKREVQIPVEARALHRDRVERQLEATVLDRSDVGRDATDGEGWRRAQAGEDVDGLSAIDVGRQPESTS